MRKFLRIAICDDEENAISIISAAIKNILSKHGIEVSFEMFTSVKNLWKMLKEQKFDLLFLDINMPILDGIQFAKRVKKLLDAPDLIFCSSKTDRVFETFEIKPFGFVRKDRFIEDMTSVISRYVEERFSPHGNSDVVGIKSGNALIKLDLRQVKYIECQNNAQIVYLQTGEPIKLYSRLTALEELFSHKDFIRIHKGYLCNLQFIKRFDGSTLTLFTNEVLPIGRSKKTEVEQKWMEYIRLHGISFIG